MKKEEHISDTKTKSRVYEYDFYDKETKENSVSIWSVKITTSGGPNKTEIYRYDLARNVYKYWSDYAKGNIKNTKYLTKTNYTSDGKYIINSEYKKDKDTMIKEKIIVFLV